MIEAGGLTYLLTRNYLQTGRTAKEIMDMPVGERAFVLASIRWQLANEPTPAG